MAPTEAASGDPAADTSDALSLHTIAEQADAYAAQEQEDADFALALALEEEETQRLIQSQNPPQNQNEDTPTPQSEPFPPYRDDPDAPGHDLEDPPPYRDDPNAPPRQSQDDSDAEHAVPPTKRRINFAKILKRIRKAWKIYLCLTGVFIFLTILIFVVVIFVIALKAKPDPKEVAWKSSNSRDYDLRLPRLYPKLEDGAHEDCVRTWEKYAESLQCHRMILSPVWDDGDSDAVGNEGADPYMYAQAICTTTCRNSITHLRNPMSNGCSRRTDRFDLTNYGKDGHAYFEKKKLEEGPIHVYQKLLNRYDRFCARVPKDHWMDSSEWGTCAADLWKRWGIVDSLEEANMNGLNKFFEATREKKMIEGKRVNGTKLNNRGIERPYSVDVPARKVGPGVDETDCGYCTIDWLERKMRSFEYGQVLDTNTSKPVGLIEFEQRLHSAIKTCGYGGGSALGRVYRKWKQYGWWCSEDIGRGEACEDDKPVPEEVRKILHGMREDDFPLPDIRKLIRERKAPKGTLQTLHNGLRDLPCSPWFSEESAIKDIIPYEHVVYQLCSDRCRNAVDRLQIQHGREFDAATSGSDPKFTSVFLAWQDAYRRVERVCLSASPKAAVRETSRFCAPGFAALGHPEWIFGSSPPPKTDIISSFKTGLDELEPKLPRYVQPPPKDDEGLRILFRKAAESVCNTCASELLIGRNPDWKKRIDEFFHDPEIDWKEYKELVKRYFVTCAKQAGAEFSEKTKNEIWKNIGLEQGG